MEGSTNISKFHNDMMKNNTLIRNTDDAEMQDVSNIEGFATQWNDPKVEETQNFFKDILYFRLSKKIEEYNLYFIVVSHAVYDLELFLEALKNIGTIKKAIFKGSSKNEKIINKIKKTYGDDISKYRTKVGNEFKKHDITKEELAERPEVIIDIVNDIKDFENGDSNRSKKEKIIIIDIGGYFAPCMSVISEKYSYLFLGIVEDTENGHQKYQKVIADSKIPVYSVARCEQKRTEDYNVGRSIFKTASSLLNDIQVRIEDSKCGVIGFGKIGSSIADNLRKNSADLLVCDHDPVIAMRASSLDYRIAKKEKILEECSIIFCATGQKSLSIDDLENIQQKNVYIASCTSADDEFSCDVKNFAEIRSSKSSSLVYTSKKGKKIHFLAKGNAVNFALGNNALGDYIRSVQGAILMSVTRLIESGFQKKNQINILSQQEESIISKLWLKHFSEKTYSVENNFIYKNNDKQKYILDKYLENIRKTLIEKSFSLIEGESGVGKTEVVKKVAIENQDYYDLIWYVDEKESNENTDLAWQQLAIKLEMFYSKYTRDEFFKLLFERLIMYKKNFLIIIDNLKTESLSNIKNNFENNLENKNYDNYLSHLILIRDVSDKEDRQKSTLSFIKIEPISFQKVNKIPLTLKEELENLFGNQWYSNDHCINLLELSGGYPFLLDKLLSYLRNTDESESRKKYIETLFSKKYSSIEEKRNAIIGETINHLHLDDLKLLKLLKFTLILNKEYIYGEIYEKYIKSKATRKYLIKSLLNYGLLERWEKRNNNEKVYCMRELTASYLQENEKLTQSEPEKKFLLLDATKVFNDLFFYKPYDINLDYNKSLIYTQHLYELKKHILLLGKSNSNILVELFSTSKNDTLNLFYRLANFYLYEERNYNKSLEIFEFTNFLCKILKIEQELLFKSINGKIINWLHNQSDIKKENIQYYNKCLEWLSDKINIIEKNKADYQDQTLIVDLIINKLYVVKYLGLYYFKAEKYEDSNKFFLQIKELISLVEYNLNAIEGVDSVCKEEVNRLSALINHFKGNFYLKYYCSTKIKFQFNQVEDNISYLDVEKYLEESIKIRERCLRKDNLDLAKSRYVYSKLQYKYAKILLKQKFLEDSKKKLNSAKNYCKLSLEVQNKNMWFASPTVKATQSLKNKIAFYLKKVNAAQKYSIEGDKYRGPINSGISDSSDILKCTFFEEKKDVPSDKQNKENNIKYSSQKELKFDSEQETSAQKTNKRQFPASQEDKTKEPKVSKHSINDTIHNS